MKKFIFILGGARSGKSSYAVDLAERLRKRTAFIATCSFLDSEMKKRIRLHKESRPRHWKLIEEGIDINSVLINLKNECETILIDCLGLWISNLLAGDLMDKEIEKEITKLINSISKFRAITILVSNEVGTGIVPDNPLARRFRDLLGMANQMMAKKADKVIFMQSGIPTIIKGGRDAEVRENNM